MTKNKFYLAIVGLLFLELNLGHASLSEDKTRIEIDDTGKRVTLTKGSIQLKSISEEDLENFKTLWATPETMKWIGKGETKSPEQSEKEFKAFMHCWNQFFDKKIFSYNMLFIIKIMGAEQEQPTFIGYVNLFTPHINWDINKEGRTELGIGILPDHQRKGQGKKAVEMIVDDYVPYLNQHGIFVAGKPIASVEATCKPENEYLNKVLKEACGKPTLLEQTSYGSPRNFYKLLLTTKD